MDLGTIKNKIKDRKYKSIPHAAEDVRLVWTNCMTYNADGSDFFKLAKTLNKKWEERYAKLVSDLQLDANAAAQSMSGSSADMMATSSKISLDDKRAFAKSLYKITKEDLGKILVEIDTKCPAAIVKNSAEDECELNVDKITPALFQELKQFVSTCTGKSQQVKKKASGSKRKSM